MFPSLWHPDFRRIWFAALTADSAAWAMIAARAWLTFDLAEENRSTWVGLVMFTAMVPYIFIPIFAGLLADRMMRRDLLACALILQVATNFILGILQLTGAIYIWHILILSLISGSAMAVQVSALESLTANLIPRNRLANAYALVNAIFHGTRLLGPGIIAPLMGFIEIGWVFIICSVVYLGSIILVLRVHTRSTGVVESTKGNLNNLFSGFIYAYKQSTLLRVFLLVVFHCSLTMSFESLLPVISDTKLNAQGQGVALMNMAVGVGALGISFVVAPLTNSSKQGRLLLATGIISGISPVALSIAPNVILSLLSTTLMGASQAGFMILASVLIQSVVPDGIRGRVSSIYIMHAAGIMSFANFGNGRLSDAFTPGLVISFGGLVFLMVIILASLEKTTRNIFLSGVRIQSRETLS